MVGAGSVHLDTDGYYRVRFQTTDLAGNSSGWVEPIYGFAVLRSPPA